MRELVSKGEIMKKRRSVLALLLVAALTVVLGGCQDGKDGKADSSDTTSSQVSTESTPTGEPVMGGSITVGIPQDIEDSLDPHKSVAAGTKEILFNIYEGLVKPDEEGNLNDAVAESHSISEDGKVYTFKLRNGVKFHLHEGHCHSFSAQMRPLHRSCERFFSGSVRCDQIRSQSSAVLQNG